MVDNIVFYISEPVIYYTPYSPYTAVHERADKKIIDIILFYISEPVIYYTPYSPYTAVDKRAGKRGRTISPFCLSLQDNTVKKYCNFAPLLVAAKLPQVFV